MTLLDRLEKRFGRYAVENVTLFLIAGQVIVFVAQYLQPNGAADLYQRLQLDPSKVYEGEVWRLFTFMFLAPLTRHPIFVLLFWYFFYFIGTALENAWSVFRFNVFSGISYLATIVAAFAAEAIAPGSGAAVGDYLFGSMFLAFARLNPEFEILLFLILPIKIKWLARLTWLGYGFTMLFGDWFSRLTALAATLNFLLFFGSDLWRDIKQGHRRTTRKVKTLKQPQKVMHECRVCGINSEMSPRTSFRYCSKCEGGACYCPDHLHNHEHVGNP